MTIGKVISLVFSSLLIGSSVALYVNRQDVLDYMTLRNYEPTTEVVNLASDASLSDSARRLFYIHDPSLLDKSAFQGKCNNDEITIVLGCYISGQKIYVFNVNDERLDGVEEVTAAHETLHAAFDRLGEDEKSRIVPLLQETFEKSTDTRLKNTVESYRKRDASIVPNELHSIIGTELRDIPVELEEYYSQYFLSRLDVVSKAEAYAAAFADREDRIVEYDRRLNELKSQIDQGQTDVEQLGAALQQEQVTLNNRRNDPESYNQAVGPFNAKVRQYNAQLERLRGQIDEFNTLVAERNAIAVEERELVEAIDTRAKEL